MGTVQRPLGEKRFVLLHHGTCSRANFHYTIQANGSIEQLLSEDERGQYAKSIGIKLKGDFDTSTPTTEQLDRLKILLLEPKLRYPQIDLGAHRQVRGEKKTTCPGRFFPMAKLREWAGNELIDERNEFIKTTVESQYGP